MSVNSGCCTTRCSAIGISNEVEAVAGPSAVRPDASSAAGEAAGDASHVLALITTHLQLELRRHAQLGACPGHATRPVRGAAGDLAHGGEILEGVRQTHDDHSMMQQRGME